MSRIKRFALLTIGFSILTPFFAALASLARPPQFFESAFGFFPYLFFSAVVLFALFVLIGRERPQTAAARVAFVAGAACFGAIIASTLRAWNDGSYYSVLTPAEALSTILTLGLFPLKAGPTALVRFFPVFFAIGAWISFRRSPIPAIKKILGIVGLYLVLALFTNALSFVGGSLALSRNVELTGPDDAYRLLVSAQADGYWTRAQSERFFAPPGAQSENSLDAIQAGILVLGASAILLLLAIRLVRSVHLLAGRLSSTSVIVMSVAALTGLALGFGARLSSLSYTDFIALVIFLISSVAWFGWWRISRDIGNLATDERDRPHLPLPSGMVSVGDAESLATGLLALACVGGFFLGWPVLVSLLAATVSVELFKNIDGGSNERRRLLIKALGVTMVAAGIGLAALSVSMRDVVPSAWMLRIVAAVALCIGIERLFRQPESLAKSRLAEAGLLAVGIGFALFLANQGAYWLFFLPFAAALLILSRSETSWRRFRAFPLYFVLLGVIGIALFASRWLVRG